MNRRNFLKTGSALSLAAPVSLAGAAPAEAAGSDTPPRLDITWLGGATLLIRFGGLTLLTDPAFGEGKNAFQMANPNEMFDLAKGPNTIFHERRTSFQGIDLGEVDHLLLSHLHEDHFDQTAEAALPKEMPTLVPAHDLDAMREKGFSDLTRADWHKTHVLETESASISITAVPADHSEDPDISALLGPGNGYWLRFQQGGWSKTVYWTGDTFPTDTVLEAIKPLGSPDILIPHMGGVGSTGSLGQISMGAEHLKKFLAFTQPQKILPIHHSTYALYLEPASVLSKALEGVTQGLDLVSEGTRVSYL
ncbi:MBL fold metallo-hydrolase [Roseibium sp.]|uniref:MBL fold metallo-hydrolase n=1 Tax=Roseibium sp. TaxID=1936156 RepID=UPI003BAED7C7